MLEADATDPFDASAKLVDAGAAVDVHASISVTRDQIPSFDPVMNTRIRSVVYGVNDTVRFTRLLPLTVPSVTHAAPFQACT